MAEIKIEKKTAIWPWILLGLGIIVLIFYLISTLKEKESVSKNPPAQDQLSINENNGTVAGFVSFVSADTAKMSLDHAYTSQALLKLADAVNATAAQIGYAIPADLDKVKAYAVGITQDAYATSHADNIRKAADLLSSDMQQMQQAKFPSLDTEAAELKQAAATISPDVLTLEQKEAVQSFFKQAASLLQKMN